MVYYLLLERILLKYLDNVVELYIALLMGVILGSFLILKAFLMIELKAMIQVWNDLVKSGVEVELLFA